MIALDFIACLPPASFCNAHYPRCPEGKEPGVDI
jgi:hypothetical protein